MSAGINSTTGQSFGHDADMDVPWWALIMLVVVAIFVLVALIATIVLCWHYHNEHEAGDARAGNMEQCVQSIRPFPTLSSVHDDSPQISRLRRRIRPTSDAPKGRHTSEFAVTEPLFSNAQRLASLESAFRAETK